MLKIFYLFIYTFVVQEYANSKYPTAYTNVVIM